MTTLQDEVVRVASGSMVSVQRWQQALDDAGIQCQVVGEELTGGVGTALPDSIELWVRREDRERAESLIREVEVTRPDAAPEDDPGAGGVD